MPALTHINFSTNRLNSDPVEHLAIHITKLVPLERLNFCSSVICGSGVRVLARCIRVMRSLSVVDLRHNRISCGGGTTMHVRTLGFDRLKISK